MLQSEYDVIVRNRRLKVLLIILTSITIALVLYAVIKVGRGYFLAGNVISVPVKTNVPSSSSLKPKKEGIFVDMPNEIEIAPKDIDIFSDLPLESKKTDFGTDMPIDFPFDIPIESSAKLTQSYRFDYEGQKRWIVVFDSMMTVKENYTYYKDYAEKHEWVIAAHGEKSDMAVVYAMKEGMKMSVRISGSASTYEVKSRVSISVLKE